MQGFRTYLVAMLVAVLPMLSEWLGGVDWVSLLTNMGVPQQLVIPLSAMIAGGLMALMRSITTTAPGKKPE